LALRSEGEKIMQQPPPVTCRKCGSPQVTGNNKGFSGGSALGGFLLAGPLGLLGGTLGSKKLIVSCLACGHQWDPTVAPPRKLGPTGRLLIGGAAAFGFVAYVSSDSAAAGFAFVAVAMGAVAAALVGRFVPTAPAPVRAFSTAVTRRMDLLVLGCVVFGAGGMVGHSCYSDRVTAEAQALSAKRKPTAAPEAPKPVAAPVAEVASEDPEKHLLTDEEKKFLNTAGDYLETVNKEDKKLAIVMAGAQTGESTIEDIKGAIQTARANEGDYRTSSVPTPFAAVDKKIRRCKALHDSAFTGMLAGARDSNTALVESGTANLERAVLLTNECIEDLRVVMKGVADKRRASAKVDAGKSKLP
jgi:hypothetical protein